MSTHQPSSCFRFRNLPDLIRSKVNRKFNAYSFLNSNFLFRANKYYDLPSKFGSKTSTQRGASIGFGKRFREGILVDKTHPVPSPQKYHLPSTISKTMKSFGASRETYDKAVIIGDN